jgi:hypothetical protein
MKLEVLYVPAFECRDEIRENANINDDADAHCIALTCFDVTR